MKCLNESAEERVSYDTDGLRKEFGEIGVKLAGIAGRYGGDVRFSFKEEDGQVLLSSDFCRDCGRFETESDADEFEGEADFAVRKWCKDHGYGCDRFDVGQMELAYWLPKRSDESGERCCKITESGEDLRLMVEIDRDYQPDNPRRTGDKLGHMAVFHGRYDLGDDDHGLEKDDYDGWEDMERALADDFGAKVVLPLSMVDHSGISVYVGRPHGWDSGMVGFAWLTEDEVEKGFGGDERKARAALEAAVKDYDENYLNAGPTYMWQIVDADEEIVDSMTGYGSEDDARREGEAYLKAVLKKRKVDEGGAEDLYSSVRRALDELHNGHLYRLTIGDDSRIAIVAGRYLVKSGQFDARTMEKKLDFLARDGWTFDYGEDEQGGVMATLTRRGVSEAVTGARTEEEWKEHFDKVKGAAEALGLKYEYLPARGQLRVYVPDQRRIENRGKDSWTVWNMVRSYLGMKGDDRAWSRYAFNPYGGYCALDRKFYVPPRTDESVGEVFRVCTNVGGRLASQFVKSDMDSAKKVCDYYNRHSRHFAGKFEVWNSDLSRKLYPEGKA